MAYNLVASIRYRCIACNSPLLNSEGELKHRANKRCKYSEIKNLPIVGVRYINPTTNKVIFEPFQHNIEGKDISCGAYLDVSKKILRRKHDKKNKAVN